ncbi:uncharacterized protein LOC141905319 [Tubulanus polymorphus]|uniref:uncharacterized protein LOC141905319 n=1 Tax=Tubulanus polymorphus TaxID=672921 RepID=UPI003DA3EE0A
MAFKSVISCGIWLLYILQISFAQIVTDTYVDLFNPSMPSGALSNGQTRTIYGSVTIGNNGQYIPSATNIFPAFVVCSLLDMDLTGPPSPIPTAGMTVAYRPTSAVNWGILGNRKSRRNIQFTFAVPADPGLCRDCQYLCIHVRSPLSTTDNNAENNWGCELIQPALSCDVDLELRSTTLPPKLFEWQDVSSAFSVIIKGSKSISAVTGTRANYEITTFYSASQTPCTANQPVPDGCLAASLGNITNTFTLASRQVSTNGISTTTLTGSIVYSALSTAALCNRKPLYVCTVVSNSTASSWSEMDTKTANNQKCNEITSRRCKQDPTIDQVVPTATCLINGKQNEIDVAFEILNKDRAAITNKEFLYIDAANTNFEVEGYLTNAATIPPDATTTISTHALTTAAPLSGGIDNVNTKITSTGKATNVNVNVKCQDITHVCAKLKKGSNPSYFDIDGSNNYSCSADATYFNDKKSCDPDISLTLSNLVSKRLATDAPLSNSYAVDLTFDVAFSNVATNAKPSDGNNVLAPCGAYDNFKLVAGIVDSDLTASRAANVCGTLQTYTLTAPAATLKSKLNPGDAALTVTGIPDIKNLQLTEESCLKPKYACVCVLPVAASFWTDADMTNNYDCHIIKQDCGPTLNNLPNDTCVYENATAESIVFNIDASDPDNDKITWHWYVTPTGGMFEMKPADSGIIRHIADPKFDYETTKEYKIHVLITDGKNLGVTGTLTVCVIDDNEPPKFVNLPAEISVPENQLHQATIFDVDVTDDENDVVTFSMTSDPADGMNRFFIDPSSGAIFVNETAGINYEYLWNNYLPDPQYLLNVSACDARGACATQIVTIKVIDVNEVPYFSPNKSVYFEIKENPTWKAPCTKWNPLVYQIQAGFDIDMFGTVRDELFYSIYEKKYSNGFNQAPPTGLDVCTSIAIDYESRTLPRIFYLDFAVKDSGFSNQGDKKAIVPLTGIYQLKIFVQNVCDHSAGFSGSYTATIDENTPVGTTVTRVTANDNDLWLYGEFWFFVDPTNVASKYFETRRRSRTTADVIVKSPIDAEVYPTIDVPVKTRDYCDIEASTILKVTVINLNDNRPIFSKDLYNWETSSTSRLSTTVGQLFATDRDNGDQATLTYEILHHARMFHVDPKSGIVSTLQNPMLPYHKYVLYSVANDNNPRGNLKSLVVTIRIDTYNECEVLTSWSTQQDPPYFTAANIQLFLTNLRPLCFPCVARLHNITTVNSKAVLLVYFLKDDSTNLLGNIGRPKEFLSNVTVMSIVNGKNLAVYGATKVVNTCGTAPQDSSTNNWLIDTIEGNMMLGFLLSIALTLWLSAIVAIGLKLSVLYCVSRDKLSHRLDTPFLAEGDLDKKSKQQDEPISNEFRQPEQPDKLQILDFRYAERPLVANQLLPDVNT